MEYNTNGGFQQNNMENGNVVNNNAQNGYGYGNASNGYGNNMNYQPNTYGNNMNYQPNAYGNNMNNQQNVYGNNMNYQPNAYGNNVNNQQNVYGSNMNNIPNDFGNNMNNNPSEFGQSYGMGNENQVNQKTKRSDLKILPIIILVLLVLIGIGVFAIVGMKSDEERFFDLLVKKQDVAGFANDLNKKALNSEQVNTTLEMDFNEIAEATGEELEEDFKLGLNLKNLAKDNNEYGTIGAEVNDEEIIVVEYAKTGEIYGIKIGDTTEKFIAIENNDLHDMFERFGVDDMDEMPNRFLTQADYEKVMKINELDLNRIANKYIKVLSDNSKDRITVEKAVELKLDDEKVKTTKYTLNLTEKAAYDLTLAIIETLKNDKENIELILNDVNAVIELMEENGYDVEYMYDIDPDEIPTSSEIIEVLEEAYDELKEEDVEDLDDEEVRIKISVYEYKGKTIGTELRVDDENVIMFKCATDKDLYISFAVEEYGDKVGEFIIKGTNNDKEFKAEFIMDADDIKATLFTMKQEYIKLSKEKMITLNKENALILNDASEDEIEAFAEEFMEGIEDLGEKLEEDFADIFGSMSFNSSSQTISKANYASFVQMFGEFSDQILIEKATLMAEYGVNGEVRNNAQLFYEVATGIPASKDMVIPEGKTFDYDFLAEGEQCYEINHQNVPGYENKTTLSFYGNEYDDEKYYVTSNGLVFTLPGFEEIQADGTVRFYVNARGNYYEEGDVYIPDEIIYDTPEIDISSVPVDEDVVIAKDGILAKAQAMYNKINIGDSRATVIKMLGEPDEADKYTSSYTNSTTEYLYWSTEDGDPMLLVTIRGDKVSQKTIDVYSDEYAGIYIGKELNTTLKDLNAVIYKVKEDMTLQEVKAILGNAMYESERDDYGYVSYIWYDMDERYVEISFDEGVTWYISSVRNDW